MDMEDGCADVSLLDCVYRSAHRKVSLYTPRGARSVLSVRRPARSPACVFTVHKV